MTDELFTKYNLSRFKAGDSAKWQKILLKTLNEIAKGYIDLEFDVKHLGYFNFNNYYTIRNNLLNKYKIESYSQFDDSKFYLKLLKRVLKDS